MFNLSFEKGSHVKVDYEEIKAQEHLYEYKITFEQEQMKEFDPIIIRWDYPIIDAHYYWFPLTMDSRKLFADYHRGPSSKATISAPVGIYYNECGQNRLTCALSDPLNSIELAMGVREENGRVACRIELFKEHTKPAKEYHIDIRLDMRDIPYYKALKDVSGWWEGYEFLKPSSVPQIAKKPMYSTWYSFHQDMTEKEIEDQCKMAKEMGCEAVIVDDGWQTLDNQRGYAFTGDWEVCEEKFQDMREHVDRVHQLGMKYILWYSVPYIGVKSKIWKRFKDKILFRTERNSSGTLDPRYPDVREYLTSIYEKALKEWDLDGFKLDFVDRFGFADRDDNIPEYNEDMDFISVDEAVDVLLSEVIKRLRDIKPDIMIEFRQRYIGPLMRKYGNMFRVADCPMDYATNRAGICDIRLLSGNTAVHSDMIMWNENDLVESTALQINNIIFGVPQVSMKLEKLSSEHKEMIQFWLKFCNEYSAVLLDGELIPHHPEHFYPVIEAKNNEKHIIGVYSDNIINIQGIDKETVIVNGKLTEHIYMDLDREYSGSVEVYNCCGKQVESLNVNWCAGVHKITVPGSGLLIIH